MADNYNLCVYSGGQRKIGFVNIKHDILTPNGTLDIHIPEPATYLSSFNLVIKLSGISVSFTGIRISSDERKQENVKS